jgi:hypothetical protein
MMLINGKGWISDNYLLQLMDKVVRESPELERIFDAVEETSSKGDRGEDVDSPKVTVDIPALRAELCAIGNFANQALTALEDEGSMKVDLVAPNTTAV